jgi:hypothetical protein
MNNRYNFLIAIGLLVVLVSWLIYTIYWDYNLWVYWPNIIYNTDIFSTSSLVFLSVGLGARVVAALAAFSAASFFLRGKWGLTATKLVVLAMVLEAFYLVSYLPTAAVGPVIADSNLVIEATIPSLLEALIVPIPLFLAALKLSQGEKSRGDAIKWACVAGVAYLFALWVRMSVQWFATFFQTPNYEIVFHGHGFSYILNFPINMFQFLLTFVGLFLFAVVFLIWVLPAIRNPGTYPSFRRIGFGLTLFGGYFITIAVFFVIFNEAGGHSIWSTFFAIHNFDRWMVSLPFLGIPLLFKRKELKENTGD